MTHMFDMRCRENGIEHRFTKVNHPWTNEQVERMNRTIKEATVQRYHYDVKTAVVTSSQNCQTVLQAAKVENLFDARVDGDVLIRESLAGKPAPAWPC